MDYIYHYSSPIGDITLASDGKALIGLWFSDQKYFGSTLSKDYIDITSKICKNDFSKTLNNLDFSIFEQTCQWLDIYFSGQMPHFIPELSMRTTKFRKEVWEIMLAIPFGQTMTYGEIADQIAVKRGTASMSAQAVGGAVAHNSISLIIPCHRVIGASGSLTGYAGGIDRKAWLLALENSYVQRGEHNESDIIYPLYRQNQ